MFVRTCFIYVTRHRQTQSILYGGGHEQMAARRVFSQNVAKKKKKKPWAPVQRPGTRATIETCKRTKETTKKKKNQIKTNRKTYET